MRHVKVVWHHENAQDPVLYVSELDEDGYESRKVQTYLDGRSEWADRTHETGTVGLSEVPFPSVEEISRRPEFDAEEITAEEFQEAWNRARKNP